jgi:hypothetical protein
MQSNIQNYRKSKRWNTKFLRQMSSSNKVGEELHKWALDKAVINPLTLNCKYKKTVTGLPKPQSLCSSSE